MAKLTLTDLSSLTNETSAITTINANNAAIEAAVELTLSRNGLTPNQMTANLDMNSFRILNMAAPVDDNDPVRLIDVIEGIQGEQGEQGPPGNPTLSDALNAIAADTASNETMYFWTGTNTGQFVTVKPFMLTLMDDDNAPTVRTTLGLGNVATRAVGTATGTAAAGDDSRFSRYEVSAQNTDINISLNIVQSPYIILHTTGTPHAYTIDPIATTAYPTGSQFTIVNSAVAGAITLTRGAGVALYPNGGTTSKDVTIATGGVCTAIHLGADYWIVSGSGIS